MRLCGRASCYTAASPRVASSAGCEVAVIAVGVAVVAVTGGGIYRAVLAVLAAVRGRYVTEFPGVVVVAFTDAG